MAKPQQHRYIPAGSVSPHCAVSNVTHLHQALVNDPSKNLKQLFEVPSGLNAWAVSLHGANCDTIGSLLPDHITYNLTGGIISYIHVGPMGSYIAVSDPSKPTEGNGKFALA